MCGRNQLVLNCISDDKSFLKTLESWIRESSNPAPDFATNKVIY